ncbi:MAG: hypothetical protein IKA45_00085 [Bacteroidales bacterium]|nr:hypothetical protein [Bacteroidales bacterium]
MPFIKEILNYESLSIVGLEKNVGKTECLNYILYRLPLEKIKVAVTSIGIDGENKDQVTSTKKPEIFLREGMYFSTAESHYKERRLVSELVEITNERSSLGRIVTAKVSVGGKALISGPSSGVSLRRWVAGMEKFGIDLTIIDGAISRLSSASPAISKAMILSTGAAFSSNIQTLVQKTKFVVEMIGLPKLVDSTRDALCDIESGVWGVDNDDNIIDFGLTSALAISSLKVDITKGMRIIYTVGALTDKLLKLVSDSKNIRNVTLVVKDFTKIFVSETAYRVFCNRGGKIMVLQKSKLIAVCVNPTAPNGYVLDSDILCRKLEEALKLPVYDIVKNNYDI